MKNNKGFTLIELMIVVAIIGIIAAILIPVFQDNLSNGCKITTESNIYYSVAEDTIYMHDDGTISFTDDNKKITISKINTDIVCSAE